MRYQSSSLKLKFKYKKFALNEWAISLYLTKSINQINNKKLSYIYWATELFMLIIDAYRWIDVGIHLPFFLN